VWFVNLKKYLHYEFWPFGIFYIPAYFYYVILAVKSKNPFYFNVLNECMENAGAFLCSKSNYLKHFESKWLPKTILVDSSIDESDLKQSLRLQKIDFPLIAKPDMGERGKEVEKIDSFNDLIIHLQKSSYTSVLIQEYIDYPNELGVLYYKKPNGETCISSIGEKEFCKIIGDGKSSFESLLKKNIRAINRMEDFKAKFKSYRHKIIAKGEVVLLEPIGNHNRGTTFLDARHKKSKHLMECVEEWANALPNFDYGRFDIKINNWDALEQKKGIKIIEVNGVNSEPIHIYDPKYNIFKAYKDLFLHMKIIQQIAFHKMKNNASPLTFFEFYNQTITYYFKKTKHPKWKLNTTKSY